MHNNLKVSLSMLLASGLGASLLLGSTGLAAITAEEKEEILEMSEYGLGDVKIGVYFPADPHDPKAKCPTSIDKIDINLTESQTIKWLAYEDEPPYARLKDREFAVIFHPYKKGWRASKNGKVKISDKKLQLKDEDIVYKYTIAGIEGWIRQPTDPNDPDTGVPDLCATDVIDPFFRVIK